VINIKKMKSSKNLNIQVIERRIEFLINEVNSFNPHYDQSITMLMRIISNHTTVGSNSGSRGVKKKNKNISKKALELKDRCSDEEFHNLTINEHQLPLKDLWDWMIENKNTITVKKILDKFFEYPFITVTKEENSSLNKIKKKNLSPEERYQNCGIEIVKIKN